MRVPIEKRIEFWDYLTTEKVPRMKGVTDRRLAKVKDAVIADDFLWSDVILRHGAEHMSAVEFYAEERRHRSDHSRWNFWAMVREHIMDPTQTATRATAQDGGQTNET